jgi:hypothetical protein
VPGSRLAAGDEPVDSSQIETVKWAEERLGANESDDSGDLAQIVRPVGEPPVFNADAHPHVRWPRQVGCQLNKPVISFREDLEHMLLRRDHDTEDLSDEVERDRLVEHDPRIVRGVVAGQYVDVALGTSESIDTAFEFDDPLRVLLDEEAVQARGRIPRGVEVLTNHQHGRPRFSFVVHARPGEAIDEHQVAGLAEAVLENRHPTTQIAREQLALGTRVLL